MSPNYDLSGVHGLNKFIWSKLKSELGWDTANYGGLVPIVTAGQQPEFNNYNAPYVIYNYSHQSGGEDFWITEEQVSYVVYSASEKDIRQFINVVREWLNRRDESAGYVNDWLRVGTNGSDENKRFDYKYTYVISTSGAQPPVSEGGRMDGMVIARIAYTYYDPTTGKDRLSV